MKIPKCLKKYFKSHTKTRVKQNIQRLRASFNDRDLNKLAQIFKTDKYGIHFYTPNYQTHFKSIKNKKINLLEIGVGGYKNPLSGGNSLRMWKAYFSKANIFAIDIYDKQKHEENRITIFKGSQVDYSFLDTVFKNIGSLDIIIDDGSHINEHVIKTFEYLFPKLNNGGVYVVEDTQTSYWPDYGGSSLDLNDKTKILPYFKALADGLNYQEFLIPNYKATVFDKTITSLHFYNNMIFIYKGDNNIKSNYLINNRKPNEGRKK